MKTLSETERKELIEFYKWYWFNELTFGLSFLELQIELLVCEEQERYEECEGIRLARIEFKQMIKQLDDEEQKQGK